MISLFEWLLHQLHHWRGHWRIAWSWWGIITCSQVWMEKSVNPFLLFHQIIWVIKRFWLFWWPSNTIDWCWILKKKKKKRKIDKIIKSEKITKKAKTSPAAQNNYNSHSTENLDTNLTHLTEIRKEEIKGEIVEDIRMKIPRWDIIITIERPCQSWKKTDGPITQINRNVPRLHKKE